MFEKYLKDIGLSDKEASIYLALLSFDRVRIADLSEKAGVKRPTTYVILESLAAKGLVSEFSEGKKTYYLAEQPEKLEHFVERQIQNLEENKKSLAILVPQLRNIQRGQGVRPVVQFFEGKEGVLSSNADTFSQKIGDEPVYNIYSEDALKGVFTDKEKQNIRARRVAMDIKSKAVYNSTAGERPSDQLGERVRIDGAKYPIKSDITVYGDSVRIAVLGKHISGIFIKNKELADTFKSIVTYILDHK